MRRWTAFLGALSMVAGFLVTIVVTAVMMASPASAVDGCDESNAHKDLSFRRDYFYGAKVGLKGWGNTANVRLTGNAYYWYCQDDRPDYDNKISFVGRRFCVEKLDNNDPWDGNAVRGFHFDSSYGSDRLTSASQRYQVGELVLDWGARGANGDTQCTPRVDFANRLPWMYMPDNPDWSVWGHVDIANATDKDFTFKEDGTGSTRHQMHPMNDVVVQP